MATTYTPNVTAQDAIKRHLAEQHPGSSTGSNVNTSVASAAAVSVSGLRYAGITGTTTITSLTGGVVGQFVTLKFAGSLTFTNGTPLKLAGAANLSATADDTITLVCTDATVGANVWHEVCHSVN